MPYKRTWSDEALADAIPKSRSWRGVARELGLTGTSVKRGLMRRANALGLDYSHFTAQRTWSDDQLRNAIAKSSTWVEVARWLGVSPRSGTGSVALHHHVQRLGLDTSHFGYARSARPLTAAEAHPFSRPSDSGASSGLSIASRWFLDRGYRVSIPLEPAPYDLIAESDTGLQRVQVKTTRRATKNGRYRVGLTHTVYDPSAALGTAAGKHRQLPYEQGVIDFFFVVANGDGKYLIPFDVVAGQKTVILDLKYAAFKVSD